jgi:WD40 repeat protein
MAWCPTMDLLAYVLGENLIAVHRMSWARLLTFEDSAPVSALCWSPDGRTLACGHDDGRLTLYDIESGETISGVQAHASKITALHWAANTSKRKWSCCSSVSIEELCKDRANSLLPNVSPSPPHKAITPSTHYHLRIFLCHFCDFFFEMMPWTMLQYTP